MVPLVIQAATYEIAHAWAQDCGVADSEWIYPSNGYALRPVREAREPCLLVDLGGGDPLIQGLLEFWLVTGRVAPWRGQRPG